MFFFSVGDPSAYDGEPSRVEGRFLVFGSLGVCVCRDSSVFGWGP